MSGAAPWPALRRPLVAILRGIRPQETEAIIGVLVEAGFEAVEIPLNSPDPFRSIEAAVRMAPANCLVGAGTVLDPADVDRLADAGGRLLVSPNVDRAVLTAAARHGMVTMPGIFTATEAFSAIGVGASALKIFPAFVLGPKGIAAISAVLPDGTVLGAVGGVSETDFESYRAAGINVFGLGSSLYIPGLGTGDVAARARATIAAYDRVYETG